MSIAGVAHWGADSLLSLVHLAQNRQVGWTSVDRKSGRWMREQQPLTKKLKLLFLFNPLVEWVDTTHLFRLWTHENSIKAGKEEGTKASAEQIQGFVNFYGINMKDFEPSDIRAYKTFEDFFIRKHTAKSRPIYEQDNAELAVVVADSRVVAYESVPEAKKLWIKGKEFTMTKLVMDAQLGAKFAGGPVASFRLSPQDYHRYHSPVSGTIRQFRSMPGDYYGVDPIVLNSNVDVLVRNARDYVVIESDEFGLVLFVAIGAIDVGKVKFHEKYQQIGATVKKGDELGYFQFGGSSIIVAFEPDRIQFDNDLLQYSKKRIQVSVEVGMSLGKARPAPFKQDARYNQSVQPGWPGSTQRKNTGDGGLWRSLEQIKTGDTLSEDKEEKGGEKLSYASVAKIGNMKHEENEGEETGVQDHQKFPQSAESVLKGDHQRTERDGSSNDAFHDAENDHTNGLDGNEHSRPTIAKLNPEAKSFHGSLNKQYGLDDSSSSNEEITTEGLVIPPYPPGDGTISGSRDLNLVDEGIGGVDEAAIIEAPMLVTVREETDML